MSVPTVIILFTIGVVASFVAGFEAGCYMSGE